MGLYVLLYHITRMLNTLPPPPDNLEEAFSIRYILITSSNVDEVADKYSAIFEKKESPKQIDIKSKMAKEKKNEGSI